jgi:hypothetical protein
VAVNPRQKDEAKKMTVNELRKLYPSKDFYFFRNGYKMQKSPFLHDRIKSFEVKGDSIFIEM